MRDTLLAGRISLDYPATSSVPIMAQTTKATVMGGLQELIGRGERIRTSDLTVPNEEK